MNPPPPLDIDPAIAAADTVAAILNAAQVAGKFNRQFTAEREYVPNFVLENSLPEGLKVFVCPTRHGIELLTRGTHTHNISILVSVTFKPPAITAEEIDPLIRLINAMKAELMPAIYVGNQIAETAIPEAPLYQAEYLTTKRGFWGMFTVTLDLARAIPKKQAPPP